MRGWFVRTDFAYVSEQGPVHKRCRDGQTQTLFLMRGFFRHETQPLDRGPWGWVPSLSDWVHAAP
ncbi:hypothetical protein ABNC28_15815, partial [Paenibacillus larvae]